ncbi:MAG: 8-oxoguanine DNA glycosylase [Peptostreptococcaceae bacterium]|nr:8-oxoguanine DNA glycosylase [Peptostreptococcaceae bacterium]
MLNTLMTDVKDINLDHVFQCGQCFRWSKIDDTYIGVVQGVFAKVTLKDNILNIEATGELNWNEYFDLNRDYGEIKATLSKSESSMRESLKYGYGMRILNQDLWEVLVSFIISQNNNIPRIKGCVEKLSKKYGNEVYEYEDKKYYSFPDANILAKLDVTDLEDIKLGYRAKYIIDAAKQFQNDRKESDIDQATNWLLSFNGIGPKVANCILLFGMGYYNAFPIDVWVKRIMKEMFGLEGDKSINEFAKMKFGEYGGFAQQYLFYYFREK